jgi:ABC-type amino acid transport system permease subunit
MTKSTSIIFILGFALLFKLEKKVNNKNVTIFSLLIFLIAIAVLVPVGDSGAYHAGTAHVYI